MSVDPYHELLTSRFVCEACLTRYFMKYLLCPACHQRGRMRPLTSSLFDIAADDRELREIIARGQRVVEDQMQDAMPVPLPDPPQQQNFEI
jgi:hypothetical protein